MNPDGIGAFLSWFESVRRRTRALAQAVPEEYMLGILGVSTPPLYGLTEPQVRERSQPEERGGAEESQSIHDDR